MNKKSRFLYLPYLFHTCIIKAKAIGLKVIRGSYPYTYFKSNISIENIPSYQLNYQKEYLSLQYLDFNKAKLKHRGELSVTQRLILGLVYYNDSLEDQNMDRDYLFSLAENLHKKASISEEEMIFYIEEVNDRFDLKGRYYSGIVQGKAASFFLRCFSLTQDRKYLLLAKKCLKAALKKVENGGVCIDLPNHGVWVEEYPSKRPSMVLNGFLFYVIGLAEYLSFEDDSELKLVLNNCLTSLLHWMPKYKVGNALLYSMYRWNLCNVHYTGIMKYQFEHLYHLTGISIFKKYQDFVHGITNWKTFDRIL